MVVDESNPWQTISRREAYRNAWISVDHDEVLTPAGTAGIYGVVRFANVALGIVTFDDMGYTHLVGQYRYPLGRYSWEIPEGGGPKHEPLLQSAARELREETGLTASRYTKLLDLDLSNSVSDETGVVFLAESLSAGPMEPEETEQLSIWRLPFAEAVAMVLRGEITDAVSVVGLLAAERHLKSSGQLR